MKNARVTSNENRKSEKTDRRLLVLVALLLSTIFMNFLFLYLLRGETKTIALTKTELVELEKQQQIITSSQQLYQTYQNEIDIISAVFPNEESITMFIQSIENELRLASDTYTFRFNAQTPIKQADKLFLPLTVTMKTDMTRLDTFFEKLETLPYMTHVTSLNVKTPEGFSNISEVVVGLKIYVQNPFITQ